MYTLKKRSSGVAEECRPSGVFGKIESERSRDTRRREGPVIRATFGQSRERFNSPCLRLSDRHLTPAVYNGAVFLPEKGERVLVENIIPFCCATERVTARATPSKIIKFKREKMALKAEDCVQL